MLGAYKLVKNLEWQTVTVGDEAVDIPTSWKLTSVGAEATITNGFTFKGSDFVKGADGHPIVRIRDLKDHTPKSRYQGELTPKLPRVNKGDVLIGMDGDFHVTEWTGATALLNQRVMNVAARYPAAKTFLKNAFVNLLKPIHYNTSATTVKHLSSVEFADAIFPAPTSRHEQAKIAAVLSTQEQVITDTKELITGLETRFRHFSRELLSGRMRVKEIDGKSVLYKNDAWKEVCVNGESFLIPAEGWTFCSLGDFGDIKTSSVDKLIKDDEQLVSLLNYMDVYGSQSKLITASLSLSKTSIQPHKLSDNFIQKGDVFFTPSSETADDIGHAAVALEALPSTVYSYHLIRFRPKFPILKEHFAANALNSAYCKKYFTKMCQGSTRKTLKKEDFEGLQIIYPLEHAEQASISGVLSALGADITQHKDLLVAEELKFKWLLDNLMTGKYLVQEAQGHV